MLAVVSKVQVIGAALAHCEVERLTDMLAEAYSEAPIPMVNNRRVSALRDVSGAA